MRGVPSSMAANDRPVYGDKQRIKDALLPDALHTVVAIRAPAQLLNERVFRGEPRLVLRLQPVGDRGATIAPLLRKRSARQGEASPYAEPLATRSGVPTPSGAFVLPPRRPVGRTDAGPPMTGRAALDPAALRG